MFLIIVCEEGRTWTCMILLQLPLCLLSTVVGDLTFIFNNLSATVSVSTNSATSPVARLSDLSIKWIYYRHLHFYYGKLSDNYRCYLYLESVPSSCSVFWKLFDLCSVTWPRIINSCYHSESSFFIFTSWKLVKASLFIIIVY